MKKDAFEEEERERKEREKIASEQKDGDQPRSGVDSIQSSFPTSSTNHTSNEAKEHEKYKGKEKCKE